MATAPVTSNMGDLKLAIRRPLAALGAVAGVIAAGIIMPSSCEFTQAQSDRLHVALPLAGPLVLALVAGWFARALKPRVLQKRWRWIALAGLMVIVGEALFNVVAAFTYSPAEAPGSFAIAWLYFMPLELALLPITLWIVAAARAADRVRRGALLDGVARRQVWLVVLGCIAPVEALVFALHGRAVSWLAYGAWGFAAASIPAIAALALFDGRAARRARAAADRRVAARSRPRRRGAGPRARRRGPSLPRRRRAGDGDRFRRGGAQGAPPRARARRAPVRGGARGAGRDDVRVGASAGAVGGGEAARLRAAVSLLTTAEGSGRRRRGA
jgi:hypothetical protein